MQRTIGYLLMTATLIALSAAPADAATVKMITKYAGRDGGEDQFQQDVIYSGVDGEENSLVINVDHQRVVFEDHRAEITTTGGCTNLSPHIAVCDPPDSFGVIEAGLGDADDTGRIDATEQYPPVTRLDGGPGNDKLQGGIASDTLDGGLGDDVVDGGAGPDSINGGGGRDELRAGTVADGFDYIEDGDTDANADADLIVGHGVGYYLTTVSYRGRSAPLTIDLPAGTAGAAGEEDRLVGGIRHVEGGKGDDVIGGTSSDDFIRGNSGADRIWGGAGNDAVLGQAGQDRVTGGSGDDRLDEESDNAFDLLDCGDGGDFVGATDARDRLARTCEEAGWSALSMSPGDPSGNRITVQPQIGRTVATFGSTCAAPETCTGRIELRTPTTRKLLGSRRFSIPQSTKPPEERPFERIRVPLTERGSDRLRRGGLVRVVITAQYDCNGCLNPPKPVKNGFTTYMGS